METPGPAEVFPVSALERFNLESLSDRITELLPESPPWFDKEQLTDKSLRFLLPRSSVKRSF